MDSKTESVSGIALGICRGVTRYLFQAGFAVVPEVTLRTGRRVDLLAIDRQGRIVIIEVKSGRTDFLTDGKWPEYREWADRLAFAVSPDFPVDLLPGDVGIMVADEYEADWLRPIDWTAEGGPMLPAARRKHVLLRFGLVAASRLALRDDPPV